ncbi:restriction endonuclease subunit S [Clostridium butyricum]|uniref:restriction endonuclease subunit S n=1 Tax=Clostridium butyricum TaxID=1492 RepID=UPI00374E3EB9
MNKNKEKVPKIRFPGFTEPWEQRKLGDVVSYIVDNRGKNPTYYCSEGIPVIDNFMIKNTLYPELGTATRFIDEELYQNFIRKYNEIDDILLTLVGNGIGNISLFPADKAVIIQNTLGLRTDENKRFLFFLLMSKNQEIVKLDRGMAQPSIRQDEILDISIKIPKMEEQEKIGTYFSNLDNLITLHQRKLNHLKDKKKGLLQKMFPKNGELVPELRFPEFTDPWEQRKLGEVSEKVTEKNKNNIYSETLTNSAEYGIINQRDFFDKDISNEKNLDGYYIVRPDDFVYNPRISNYAPVGPINRNNLGRSGVMSPLYYVFRTHSVDKIFLEKYFSSNNWHKFMKLNGDSGARADRFAIKDSVFREMPIPSPAIEEQTKIGEFFQGIDNLITLHQRKLDHLKEQKKALLQQMFI